MGQYILVYKSNEASDWTQLPKGEVTKVMNAWGAWLGSMGPARKAGEAFKFGGKSVTKNGEQEADNLLTGFSIVEAKDFDEALAIAQKAPIVISGEGSIEVYEALML